MQRVTETQLTLPDASTPGSVARSRVKHEMQSFLVVAALGLEVIGCGSKGNEGAHAGDVFIGGQEPLPGTGGATAVSQGCEGPVSFPLQVNIAHEGRVVGEPTIGASRLTASGDVVLFSARQNGVVANDDNIVDDIYLVDTGASPGRRI